MYHINFCTREMHKQGLCTDLIEMTANELSDNVVALMLVAEQSLNVELSIRLAIRRYVRMCTGTRMRKVDRRYRIHVELEQGIRSAELVIKKCILAFPSLWVSCNTPSHLVS